MIFQIHARGRYRPFAKLRKLNLFFGHAFGTSEGVGESSGRGQAFGVPPSGLVITHIFSAIFGLRFSRYATRQILPLYKLRLCAQWEVMNESLLSSDEWAQAEFALADLGDARRTDRLVQVASALVQCPSGTLPQAFDEWSELKGAYRLFSNEAVNYEDILRPHLERTRQRCTEPGEYLLIEDTSDLDFSTHRACKGLGQIGNQYGRGLLLHSTLAVRVSAWGLDHCPEVEVVGLAGQKCWARPKAKRSRKKEHWRKRLNRQRESERWGNCSRKCHLDLKRSAGSMWPIGKQTFMRALSAVQASILLSEHIITGSLWRRNNRPLQERARLPCWGVLN
jgi:hypothetical protein